MQSNNNSRPSTALGIRLSQVESKVKHSKCYQAPDKSFVNPKKPKNQMRELKRERIRFEPEDIVPKMDPVILRRMNPLARNRRQRQQEARLEQMAIRYDL